MRKKQGFTLIELLVVIAIIGILSTITFVSLRNVPNQAKDSRIKTNIQQIGNIAGIIFSSESVFSSLCLNGAVNSGHTTEGANLQVLASDIDTQNGNSGGAPACFSDADNYCVSAILKTGGNICISNQGQVGNDACTAANTLCTP